MPKPEDSPKQNHESGKESPVDKKAPKSVEFQTFREAIIELGQLIRKSPARGFDKIKNLLKDDTLRSEEKADPS